MIGTFVIFCTLKENSPDEFIVKRGTKRGRPGPESHKTPVVALVQRGGKIKAFPVERVTSATLRNALRKNVSPSATLMTDEFGLYRKLGKEFADHQTACHGIDEYVRGEATRCQQALARINRALYKGRARHRGPQTFRWPSAHPSATPR